MYHLKDGPSVLRKWRTFLEDMPELYTPIAIFWSVPEGMPPEAVGTPVVIIAGVYAGPVEDGEKAVKPLRSLATPVLDLSAGWAHVSGAKMSPKARSTRRRRRRQLETLGEVEASVARTRAEVEPALEEAFRVYALRWEGRLDPSGFVTPTDGPMYFSCTNTLHWGHNYDASSPDADSVNFRQLDAFQTDPINLTPNPGVGDL